MGLADRIQGAQAARVSDLGARALDDPEYARLLAKARVRLHRALQESLPNPPELTDSDVEMLRAIDSVGLPPVTVVLFGQEKIGAKQIVARLVVKESSARVQMGVATMDEWGEFHFREEQAPPPLLRRD